MSLAGCSWTLFDSREVGDTGRDSTNVYFYNAAASEEELSVYVADQGSDDEAYLTDLDYQQKSDWQIFVGSRDFIFRRPGESPAVARGNASLSTESRYAVFVTSLYNSPDDVRVVGAEPGELSADGARLRVAYLPADVDDAPTVDVYRSDGTGEKKLFSDVDPGTITSYETDGIGADEWVGQVRLKESGTGNLVIQTASQEVTLKGEAAYTFLVSGADDTSTLPADYPPLSIASFLEESR
mgnify:CR=1 FL=1